MKETRLYILDLDHCLIYSSYQEIHGLDLISKRKFHFLYHRPNLKNILKYVQKTGDIAFYTSSKMDYAKWVVTSFQLDEHPIIYSRKYCKKKYTEYGETYLKSIVNLPITKSYNKVVVLDDRTDLWNDKGVELNDIKPWMGEVSDIELSQWLIRVLKRQPKF
jgi:TFIIF-interacting CTD phosphatase-like protein